MNNVYPLAIDAAIDALINGGTGLGPIKAMLVDDLFVYSPADTVIGDVTGTVGTAASVTVTSITDGILRIGPVSFVGITEGWTVRGLVFYLDGNDQLLCNIDTRADTTPVGVETDGGTLVFTFERLLKL